MVLMVWQLHRLTCFFYSTQFGMYLFVMIRKLVMFLSIRHIAYSLSFSKKEVQL